MRILLDTSTLLWTLGNPARLGTEARAAISEPQNQRIVSAASAWEIATKHRLGRLPIAASLVVAFEEQLVRIRADVLSINVVHALAAGSFRHLQADPFDRMLAAQALLEGLPLVTNDTAFAAFGVTTIW